MEKQTVFFTPPLPMVKKTKNISDLNSQYVKNELQDLNS